MTFELLYTSTADSQLDALEKNRGLVKRCKAVKKALGLMQVNMKHPSLNTHKYSAMTGANGEEVFEAYAENKTPAAYRIFWHYGPKKGQITIVAIIAHP